MSLNFNLRKLTISAAAMSAMGLSYHEYSKTLNYGPTRASGIPTPPRINQRKRRKIHRRTRPQKGGAK